MVLWGQGSPCSGQSLRAKSWWAKGRHLLSRALGPWGGQPTGSGSRLLGFVNLSFERALKMLAFKVVHTWQNTALSLEGRADTKQLLKTAF